MIELNRLTPAEAEQRVYSCFASHRWARLVAIGRPYPDLEALLAGAEEAWAKLEAADWSDALAGHPRIGEGGGSSTAASEREQSGVRAADAETLAQLAEENRRYEERFGHVFLIAAAGRGGGEILVAMRRRMANDPVTEAQTTAAEHRKIARFRLAALFS
ncbi:MAG: 2-oxo-4-hydroxy-4-carboxy-5-ureidoimidazoline decarboxylase [Candidatus Dormibacteraeota bacterium]|nr:2-oxo-4-hydroxy-4-carboxy-5-ureidoimidazoline decarboxylase [Candidatus Dormibacteraeota bacterium]